MCLTQHNIYKCGHSTVIKEYCDGIYSEPCQEHRHDHKKVEGHCGYTGVYCSKTSEGQRLDEVYTALNHAQQAIKHIGDKAMAVASLQEKMQLHIQKTGHISQADQVSVEKLNSATSELQQTGRLLQWNILQLRRQAVAGETFFKHTLPDAVKSGASRPELSLPSVKSALPASFNQAILSETSRQVQSSLAGPNRSLTTLHTTFPASALVNHPAIAKLSISSTTGDRSEHIKNLARAELACIRNLIINNTGKDPDTPVRAKRIMRRPSKQSKKKSKAIDISPQQSPSPLASGRPKRIKKEIDYTEDVPGILTEYEAIGDDAVESIEKDWSFEKSASLIVKLKADLARLSAIQTEKAGLSLGDINQQPSLHWQASGKLDYASKVKNISTTTLLPAIELTGWKHTTAYAGHINDNTAAPRSAQGIPCMQREFDWTSEAPEHLPFSYDDSLASYQLGSKRSTSTETDDATHNKRAHHNHDEDTFLQSTDYSDIGICGQHINY